MTDVHAAWNKALADLSRPDVYATADAWSVALKFLSNPSPKSAEPSQQVIDAFVQLRAVKQTDALLLQVLDLLSGKRPQISALVQKHMALWKDSNDVTHILSLLATLREWHDQWLTPLLLVGAGTKERSDFSNRLQMILVSTLPVDFGFALYAVFAHALESDGTDGTAENLQILGLVTRFKPLLMRLVYSQIEDKIKSECAGQWAGAELDRILQWLKDSLAVTIRHILSPPALDSQKMIEGKEVSMTFTRAEHHIYKVLCDLRISELFDIIVEYPESFPALMDLQVCLDRTNERLTLAQKLRDANMKRLLHPGADTKDIIDQYISTIRCLRMVDPSGVLLSRVAHPIRTYLREREDTIRCIMSALIEEGGELVAELQQTGSGEIGSAQTEAENYSDPHWQPDPIDAPPNFHLSRSGDIIQILVSIYDTKDVFIQEFQVLLAQSLLEVKDYEISRHVRNVETLKKRFGESSLSTCEVMLKDLADSKRIDQNIHGVAEMNPMHPTIVSHLFWPALQSSRLRLPHHLAALQQSYQQAFTSFKPDKYLRWMPHLGSVDVEIELDDRTLALQVTPLQAAVAELFQERTVWTLDEIASQLTVPKDVPIVKNAVYFWSNNGLLREDVDTQQWVLMETVAADDQVQMMHQHPIIPNDPTGNASQPIEEEMREFWQFIVSMLANLGSLPIDRIHTMLARTVPAYKGRSQDELLAFLRMAKTEGALRQKTDNSWALA